MPHAAVYMLTSALRLCRYMLFILSDGVPSVATYITVPEPESFYQASDADAPLEGGLCLTLIGVKCLRCIVSIEANVSAAGTRPFQHLYVHVHLAVH